MGVLLISNLWAVDQVGSAVEQAQALALKKNRQGAALILNEAWESSGSKNRVKMSETLNSIARVFFTDKGQKLFESGQSSMFENPEAALAQFREALALEDNNILVLDNIARIQLSKMDCDGALASARKGRVLYPTLGEPAVLELRALICLKNFEAFRDKLKSLPSLEKNQDSFVQYLSAQDFLQQRMWRKATDVLLKVSEDEPRFPEPYFLLTRAGREMDRDVDVWAQKYVSLCKGITPRERRRFSLEPRLCVNAKEVQDELAKKTTDL